VINKASRSYYEQLILFSLSEKGEGNAQKEDYFYSEVVGRIFN
jgi:hypothetical protein